MAKKKSLITHELLQAKPAPTLYDASNGTPYAINKVTTKGKNVYYHIYNDTTFSDGSKLTQSPTIASFPATLTEIRSYYKLEDPNDNTVT